MLGLPREECLPRFLKGRRPGNAEAQAWMERKDTYYQEHLAQLPPGSGLPGVRAFLQDARDKGLQLGVASASRNARAVLGKLGLLDFFFVVGDANLAIRSKPAPDIYIWVAGYLRAQVGATVVFEDSPFGIQAASNAGFWTVGIGSPGFEQAHISLRDLQNVRVVDILGRVATMSGDAER